MSRAIVFPFTCTDTAMEKVADLEPAMVIGAWSDFSARQLAPGGAPSTWREIDGGGDVMTLSGSGQVMDGDGMRFVRLSSGWYDQAGTSNDRPRSRFIRFRLRSLVTGRAFVSTSASGAMNIIIDADGKLALNAGSNLASTVQADREWHTIIAVYNGEDSVLRVDGQEWVGQTGSGAGAGFRVGGPNVGTYSVPIDVARFGMFTSALNAADRARVEAAIAGG